MSPRYILDSIKKKKPRPPKSKDIYEERERVEARNGILLVRSTSTCEKENSVCDWIGLDPLRNTLFFFFLENQETVFQTSVVHIMLVVKRKKNNGDLKTTYDELCCVLFQLLLLLMLLLSLRINTVWIERFQREKGREIKRERWVCVSCSVCMM